MTTGEWSVPDPARSQEALRLLHLACNPGASVADLGCLHGAYSMEFARNGYQVTGIDARAEHIDHCNISAAALELPDLRFVQDDVRNLAAHGTFDAVFCCGLLYHLDKPVEFLRTLGQVTTRLLIIQTHYSLEGGWDNEGARGEWYSEDGDGNPWASWGNHQSFWLMKHELLAAVQDAGFDLVFECYDHLADINGSPSRGMFAGIKTGKLLRDPAVP